ncbi:MAG: TetR/AcrR family transcriptional regulator [Acidimicrobiales bacterium]
MTTWLADERHVAAEQRLLDAAGRVFVRMGVAAAGMADIADEAGCSRATLYRHFRNRDALRSAFVTREAVRVAREVGRAGADTTDPAERMADAIVRTVATVRSTPALAAWFAPDEAGPANRLAVSSEVIEAIAGEFLGEAGDDLAARWLVRSVVSLLTNPGADEAEERALVERFLVPSVLGGRPAHYGAAHG